MKKPFLICVSTAFALLLTACGSRTFRSIPTVVPQTDSSGMTTDYQNALPIESQLLVGTFKLEGTNQAVNANQASDLVAYWQLLKELSTSGSAAPQEIDATVAAIESAMTPEQLKAIIAMHITRQDMFTILREQGGGFATGAGTQSGTRTQSNQSQNGNNQRNFNFGPPGGFQGGPAGGFGDGGGFGSQRTNSNRTSNSQSRNSSNNPSANGNGFSSNRVPSALLDAIINLLKGKAKS